ncbi:MAG: alpha/beta hydrolase [Acidobacteria bacterium]|nr:alpha/beta hydrolase [Acidobacteriota bacterium]
MRPAILLALSAAALHAQGLSYPPRMEGATDYVYKTAAGVPLKIYVFQPTTPKPPKGAPAIVFFFGGGWTNGNPAQFEQHCRHLASRGMVAITADYRVASRQGVKAVECLRDARSAIRWIRANAKMLGIDPNRLAVGGGSAGGHLAAAAALISEYNDPSDNLKISARPDALVLYNPAAVLASIPGLPDWREPAGMEQRMGVPLESISPYHHIAKGAPPTIIFHGKADTTVPYVLIEAFTRRMTESGNRCELHGYDGETHGFFNYGRGGNKAFQDTLAKTDAFLVTLGYLKP